MAPLRGVQPRTTAGEDKGFLEQINFKRLAAGTALLVLSAVYSPVILLTLAPVYGSAPPHLFHPYVQGVVAAAGWFLKDHVLRQLGRRSHFVLPVLAFWIPSVQHLIFQMSSVLGNLAGPVVTELLTFYPLLFLSVAYGGKMVQSGLNLTRYGELAVDHVPLICSFVVYSTGERLARAVIARSVGSSVLLTRVGMQLVLASFYALVVPSKWLLLAAPSLLFTLTSNVHLPLSQNTRALNAALEQEGFRLVARQESVTGYVSVVDNLDDGFRVMRCDHSILGGQWTGTDDNYSPAVKDPIYSVFAMLEAVRLVETETGESRSDMGSKALVIGLGVGTTPASLINHGIETTIVEIDPVIHQFALEYFHLPRNHISVIDDAAAYVQRAAASNQKQYDYIIHDVFTGGAEPINLFTIEFLTNLAVLLKPDGVIAINYAGDVTSYPAGLIVRTIRTVFSACRVYRESMSTDETNDFTNLVVFCKKQSQTTATAADPTRLRFRAPEEADYLGSKSRESYLLPQHEVDPATFDHIVQGGKRVLTAAQTENLGRYMDQGAIAHWKIMRKVLPDAVWENW